MSHKEDEYIAKIVQATSKTMSRINISVNILSFISRFFIIIFLFKEGVRK